MGVYVKTLLIAAIIVALTTSALVMSDVADRIDPSWANALIALAGVLIGGFVMLAMRAMRVGASTISANQLTADPEPERVVESAPVASAAPVPSPPAAPPAEENVRTDEGFMGFVEELMAATTSDGLLAAVKTKLPPLIGGRKVWIVSELQTRHAPEGVEQPAPDQDTQLTAAIQQWTTFPLRANNKSVGLLGVESAGGLGTERQQVVERLTPLLARAVSTVGTIETFREAGLVDLLTGAATRREGLNRLNSEVKRAQRTGTSMAVLMVDLDHFKSVNDRYGHAVGDALLTAIGRTLRGTLRASDIRCRWGGEEFLIVLPDTDLARAQVVAGHLLHNIANAYVPMPSGPVTTTASIGLTISRPRESAGTNLVARADLALYRAKREGRSCIRVVLGDHEGKPIGVSSQSPEPSTSRSPALPFPDRRSAERTDRRRVPSSGRRRTDPAPPAEGAAPPSAGNAERRGQVMAASR